MHYIDQSKKIFTQRGSITLNWFGKERPFRMEIIYSTRAEISHEEIVNDVKNSSVQTIDYTRKFIPNADWNSLDNMVINGKIGSITINK